jgi:hypothetical protein
MSDMKAKEFLSQAYRIDRRINSKLEMVMSLRELAGKASATLTGEKVSGTRNIHHMEDAIIRMADLEDEINRDIMNLVELKQAIVRLIRHVGVPDQQTILELRYISFWAWERIAVDLNYSLRQTHRLHSAALDSCDAIMRRDGRYAKMAYDVIECHA